MRVLDWETASRDELAEFIRTLLVATTASILMSEIARATTGNGSGTIPLNGTAVLRAALSGEGGTINDGRGD